MEAYSSSYAFETKPHSSLLHSVRKSQAKPWKKAPVAPPPPTPIRVYQVDAINFRNVVQQLTGAPEFKPQVHHQSVATSASTGNNNWYRVAQSEALELNLSSPSTSYNWCSVPHTSQGTITTFESGRVI
ncbi:hypothetical protein RJT34_05643 [Clitoria ternatea]|uniref:VQ domain-containing protein n=1 Tax=Clitoria ternatea TaxID=43366 RepID=A0AAN9PSP8_CLITE